MLDRTEIKHLQRLPHTRNSQYECCLNIVARVLSRRGVKEEDLGGWQGKILRVNLTEGSVIPEDLNQEWAEQYLGQRGLASKYLYGEIDPSVDPLSPENKMIIGTGPLTGTMASTGRC